MSLQIPEECAVSCSDSVYSCANGDFLAFDDLCGIIKANTGRVLTVAELKGVMESCPGLDWGEVCGYIAGESGWGRGLAVTEIEKLISFIEGGQA